MCYPEYSNSAWKCRKPIDAVVVRYMAAIRIDQCYLEI